MAHGKSDGITLMSVQLADLFSFEFRDAIICLYTYIPIPNTVFGATVVLRIIPALYVIYCSNKAYNFCYINANRISVQMIQIFCYSDRDFTVTSQWHPHTHYNTSDFCGCLLQLQTKYN